jgi:glycosyltransferase involved in cell wall biosynthesis
MVGTPSKGYVSDKFHTRFCAMQPRLRLPHTMISGKPIDLARNVMVTKALQESCEYVFFLDSDILVNPDALLLLHQVNMPIVSAVYYSRAPPQPSGRRSRQAGMATANTTIICGFLIILQVLPCVCLSVCVCVYACVRLPIENIPNNHTVEMPYGATRFWVVDRMHQVRDFA